MTVTMTKDGEYKDVSKEDMVYFAYKGWKVTDKPAVKVEEPVKKGRKRSFEENKEEE